MAWGIKEPQHLVVRVLLQDFETNDGSDKDDNSSSSSTCTSNYCGFDFYIVLSYKIKIKVAYTDKIIFT